MLQTDIKNSIDIVAKTLYGEARSEHYEGILAVATVIYNRAKGVKEDFAKVCLKPKQFSCWNGVENIEIWEYKSWEICKKLAETMFTDNFKPYPFKNNLNPTHYCTVKLYNSSKCPNWARGQVGEIIKNHIFFKLK